MAHNASRSILKSTRLKKIWTDSEKNWPLFNIHTSDKLEIFFDHSILVNAALMVLTHGVYTVFLARH